jgi:UDP-glucose 4-epimerase
MNTILVTGGAGYIGSHVTRQLRARGENVVVLDNLSSGFRSAVLDAPLVVGDTGDSALVAGLLREHGVSTVLHFAAHTIVPESVADPLKYYRNNTCATRSLLQCCSEAGVSGASPSDSSVRAPWRRSRPSQAPASASSPCATGASTPAQRATEHSSARPISMSSVT